LLSEKALVEGGTDQLAQLTKAQSAVDALMHLWDKDIPTFQIVLNSIAETKLFQIPDVLAIFTGQPAISDVPAEEQESDDQADEELAAWREFLDSPFDQIAAYADYVSGTSPFGTHQGVKGLEFPRVMVVISDEEARGFMFSYEKLFGAKTKSDADLRKEEAGQETSIDRTRRLFYVTCSRAEESLAIAAYSDNPDVVKHQVVASGWFMAEEVESVNP
jgi:DNA helicase-2/ATP-dependent DNA helicase PcrA